MCTSYCWFFHLRPANQPTVTDMPFPHANVEDPCSKAKSKSSCDNLISLFQIILN